MRLGPVEDPGAAAFLAGARASRGFGILLETRRAFDLQLLLGHPQIDLGGSPVIPRPAKGVRRERLLPELLAHLPGLGLGLLDDGAALRRHRGHRLLLVAVPLERAEQSREHPPPAPLLALVLGYARRVLRARVDAGGGRVGARRGRRAAVAVHVAVAVEGGPLALARAAVVAILAIRSDLKPPAARSPVAVRSAPGMPVRRLPLVQVMLLALERVELALQRLQLGRHRRVRRFAAPIVSQIWKGALETSAAIDGKKGAVKVPDTVNPLRHPCDARSHAAGAANEPPHAHAHANDIDHVRRGARESARRASRALRARRKASDGGATSAGSESKQRGEGHSWLWRDEGQAARARRDGVHREQDMRARAVVRVRRRVHLEEGRSAGRPAPVSRRRVESRRLAKGRLRSAGHDRDGPRRGRVRRVHPRRGDAPRVRHQRARVRQRIETLAGRHVRRRHQGHRAQRRRRRSSAVHSCAKR